MKNMKKVSMRVLLSATYIMAMPFFTPYFNGQFSAQIVDSIWSICFVIAVVLLTGRAPLFVFFVVLISSAIYPLGILCWMGLQSYGTLAESANNVISNFYKYGPLRGGELFMPIIASTITSWFLFRLKKAQHADK